MAQVLVWMPCQASQRDTALVLLAAGRLVPALGQADSTLVAVSIFLLLSSLTYLLFKLSPRWVARGVCESMCLRACDRVCV